MVQLHILLLLGFLHISESRLEPTDGPIRTTYPPVPQSGYVQSPNFPNDYPNNYNHNYTIVGADNNVIEIKFLNFSVEGPSPRCPYDWVLVTDGDGTILLNKTCGNTVPELFFSKTSRAVVTFYTDYSVVKTGWKLYWRSVETIYLCPLPFVPLTDGSGTTKCYALFGSEEPERQNWFNAQIECMGKGSDSEDRYGNLASITDEVLNGQLVNLIVDKGITIASFIGGTGTAINSTDFLFTWWDGTPFDFTKFADGEPNNAGGNEHCLTIHSESKLLGQWNDLRCLAFELPYICSLPTV